MVSHAFVSEYASECILVTMYAPLDNAQYCQREGDLVPLLLSLLLSFHLVLTFYQTRNVCRTFGAPLSVGFLKF
jgi:hypothetical protein